MDGQPGVRPKRSGNHPTRMDVACCMLYVVCRMSYVVCCMLLCCMLLCCYVGCRMSYGVCWMLHVVCRATYCALCHFLAINASLPHAAGRASSFGRPFDAAMQPCCALPADLLVHELLEVAVEPDPPRIRVSPVRRCPDRHAAALCASNTPRRN